MHCIYTAHTLYLHLHMHSIHCVYTAYALRTLHLRCIYTAGALLAGRSRLEWEAASAVEAVAASRAAALEVQQLP